MKRVLTLLVLLLLTIASLVSAESEARLLRFPAIHGNQIVFSYAGDLYSVAATGGIARKLTNDIGYEMFARFSPDGESIAFTGQYDGNTEVYIMPSEGGVPTRLTFTPTLDRDDVSDRMGPNNIVMAWRDNDHIVYRSRGIEWNDFIGQLFEVSKNGGMAQELPLPRGGFCSFSPDGHQMVYNRVFREFRTWKHYRGGQADDVWLYNFDTKETRNLTNNPAQDIIPMWSGNHVYFVSDRDSLKRMNLYVYDFGTGATRKLTNFTDFDVKFPSLGDRSIIFENGGYLYTLDLTTEQVAKVTIYLNEDFAGGRNGLVDVSKAVNSFEIAPDGNRALFEARGELFTVPAKYGNVRNITNTTGIHERNPKWSADGRWIAYISDATGEDEIYIKPQDGSGESVQLTRNGDTYKYAVYWSPDSKKLLWADKKLRLQYVDVDTKKVTLVAQATAWEYSDYAWSPDSRWIAYAQNEEKQMATVYLYSVESGKSMPVTDGWFSSYEPSFSSDGKYLYFVSDRSFNPIYSETEWNHAYLDMAKIYLISLAKTTKSPFEPKSDEVAIKEATKEKAKGEKKVEKEGVPAVVVDADGIQSRIAVLPISASGYGHLVSVGDKLYYQRRGSKDEKSKLLMYDFGKLKETELGDVTGFEISFDTKKILIGAEGSYAIIDLPTAKFEIHDRLNLADMKVMVDHHAEWNQIFNESWRQMRDFYFNPLMHGVDWEKVRETYAQLVPYVNHRADLTYILGEMIGEINSGHTYVGGGEMPHPERIKTGLLGADVEQDAASHYYLVRNILRGQNWDNSLHSPLTEIGVAVHDGDFILAVDGKPTNTMPNMYAALVGTVGKQVTLTVNSKPSTEGSWKTVVVPIADEHELRYFNWVQGNIAKVSKATDGKVGYIHIPDMGTHGLNEFVKYFYPQLRKEALIIDDRGNGGGNVSPMIIDRLRRQIAMIDIARNTALSPDPETSVLGPMVALTDEFSASDGDIFAYRFKKYKLGPVIGKRTWGGVVGIRGSLPFLDGGYLTKPEFSRYDVEGREWIMEGHGVDPDIVVDNDPAKEWAGDDQQLDKAIAVIENLMKEHPVVLPPPPPYPNKY